MNLLICTTIAAYGEKHSFANLHILSKPNLNIHYYLSKREEKGNDIKQYYIATTGHVNKNKEQK